MTFFIFLEVGFFCWFLCRLSANLLEPGLRYKTFFFKLEDSEKYFFLSSGVILMALEMAPASVVGITGKIITQ